MLERMDEFFAARADGYDNHMLTNVEGCKEAYIELARLLPRPCGPLLDLGCGTGLELDEIFRLQPDAAVTGIDLTRAMLDKLEEKHGDKNLRLLCGSYFDLPFGSGYGCAVSFQTLHHFSHADKLRLYAKIHGALKEDGVYIECDYMVETQADEDHFFAENRRLRRELGIGPEEFYHYDTPCTVDNQISLLRQAGFADIAPVFRMGATTILVARK